MSPDGQTDFVSSRRRWTGRVISGIAVLFLIFDGTIHIAKPAPVVEAFAQMGFPLSTSVGIGLLELACLSIYVIPRSAVFGAVLLTGYLGGAIAAQVRVGSPLFSTVLFPVYVAVLVWGGLYLRDRRLGALLAATD